MVKSCNLCLIMIEFSIYRYVPLQNMMVQMVWYLYVFPVFLFPDALTILNVIGRTHV